MIRSLILSALICAFVGMALSGATVRAADTPPAASQPFDTEERVEVPVVDARADAWLKKMSDYLAGLKQFSIVADTVYDRVSDTTGQKLQFSKVSHIDVARPDRLCGVTEGDLRSRKYWYDGKQLVSLDAGNNTYSVTPVPSTIDAMFDFMAERYGLVVPVADLLFSDVYRVLKDEVQIGQYLGVHKVGKYNCHHLAFTQENVDWQIWIEDGDTPLPRKLVITYKHAPESPQYCTTFAEWKSVDSFPPDHFQFQPPAGANRIERRPVEGSEQTRTGDKAQ